MIGQAHWRASYVPAARGDWSEARVHVRAIQDQSPSFERHIAANAIAAAGLAAARERPDEVLAALAALESIREADGVNDPAFVPWHHLKAHALVDAGRCDVADDFIAGALDLADARENTLLVAQLVHARGKLALARRDFARAAVTLRAARERIEALPMPYEHALIDLSLGQALRRAGERRAASDALVAAHDRFAALRAQPALSRSETELAACGLRPTARKRRDRTALTPQELAVARLVVDGMTNREVAAELMLSAKTVEFHLSNIYAKLGVRTRAQLRARARANELSL